MKRLLWLVCALVPVVLGGWYYTHQGRPPVVSFEKANRQTIVSILSTNGKAEPSTWQPVAAERAARVAQVFVQEGAQIRAGAPLLRLSDPLVDADLASAEARLTAARASLAAIDRGGPSRELAEIDGSIAKLQVDRQSKTRDIESIGRLVEKHAATAQELRDASDELKRVNAEIASLNRRRAALVDRDDRSVAQARVQEAERLLNSTRKNAAQLTISAPLAGVVYELSIREGDWTTPGQLVARVGQTDPMRILIYVDEPDLGRVARSQKAKITWDAQPRKSWTAEVTSVPSQVVALGSRQVGEVIATASNPEHQLPPGANVNVEIRAQVAENALAIPRAALRRQSGETGVLVLENGKLAWRKVEAGISSMTVTEIRSGLTEGELVAMPSDQNLAPGMAVTAGAQ